MSFDLKSSDLFSQSCSVLIKCFTFSLSLWLSERSKPIPLDPGQPRTELQESRARWWLYYGDLVSWAMLSLSFLPKWGNFGPVDWNDQRLNLQKASDKAWPWLLSRGTVPSPADIKCRLALEATRESRTCPPWLQSSAGTHEHSHRGTSGSILLHSENPSWIETCTWGTTRWWAPQSLGMWEARPLPGLYDSFDTAIHLTLNLLHIYKYIFVLHKPIKVHGWWQGQGHRMYGVWRVNGNNGIEWGNGWEGKVKEEAWKGVRTLQTFEKAIRKASTVPAS